MLRRPNPSPLPPLSFTQAYGLSVTKHQRPAYVSLWSSTFWPCAFSSPGFCFDLVRISTVPSGTTPSWPFSHAHSKEVFTPVTLPPTFSYSNAPTPFLTVELSHAGNLHELP